MKKLVSLFTAFLILCLSITAISAAETSLTVSTRADILIKDSQGKYLTTADKGSTLTVTGYDSKLDMFAVKYNNTEGYISGNGLSESKDELKKKLEDESKSTAIQTTASAPNVIAEYSYNSALLLKQYDYSTADWFSTPDNWATFAATASMETIAYYNAVKVSEAWLEKITKITETAVTTTEIYVNVSESLINATFYGTDECLHLQYDPDNNLLTATVYPNETVIGEKVDYDTFTLAYATAFVALSQLLYGNQ